MVINRFGSNLRTTHEPPSRVLWGNYLLISGSCKRSLAKRVFVLGTSPKQKRETPLGKPVTIFPKYNYPEIETICPPSKLTF